MIRVIPNENESVVVYRGRAYRPKSGWPGDPAFFVEGERVPLKDLDAWYTERMVITWRGQKFSFDRYRDGVVRGLLRSWDADWARANGLGGDRYEGWWAEIPENEIEAVEIE